MRNTIVNKIHEAARTNKKIVFLTGDLGYSVIEEFQRELPEQCINVGIAEQNMVGMAAGLALEGKKVFVYSIVPFATMRCLEQIRVDVCYQNLDVTVIGIGGGFAYGTLGVTHYGMEDIAVMRSLPNMKIYVPLDAVETEAIISQHLQEKGPAYIRLNRGKEPDIHDDKTKYAKIHLGLPHILKEGNDITIISCGDIVRVAMEVADIYEKEDISVKVVSMHTIKPLDISLLQDTILNTPLVITLEEHTVIGGLGSAVSEIIAENNMNLVFRRMGTQDIYQDVVGRQDYMRKVYGISAGHVYDTIKKLL